MKTLIAIAVILMSAAAFGQQPDAAKTFHVVSIHDWTPNDPAPSSHAFKTVMVIGNVGNLHYSTQQMLSWGSTRFEVGKDYPVLKADSKAITVSMTDKKGREVKERLDVTGVEEKQ